MSDILHGLQSWMLSAPLIGPLARWVIKYREVLLRCTVTVVLLAVIRCGLFIPLPGVDLQHLPVAPSSEGAP